MYRKLLEDHYKCSHIEKFTANYQRVSQDVKNFFQVFCEFLLQYIEFANVEFILFLSVAMSRS